MKRVSRIALCAGSVALLGVGALALNFPRTDPPGEDSGIANRVTSFATDHPEWAILRTPHKDATPLRLNHARHLDPNAAGMEAALAPLGADPAKAMAWGLVRTKDAKYSLSCASCHQPDAGGRYMQPVVFARACSACHSTREVNIAPGLVPPTPAPHGDVAALSSLIARKLAEAVALTPLDQRVKPDESGAAGAGESPAPKRRRGGDEAAPSGPPQLKIPALATKDETSAWLSKQQSEFLSAYASEGQCGHCHVVDAPASDGAALGFSVQKPQIPSRWLPRASFNHQPHTMLSCVACHSQTPTSQSTGDILLPGIETCRACHAPRASDASTATKLLGLGGRPVTARHSCVTCHLYHDRSSTPGEGGLTIPEFLREKQPPTP